MNVTESGTFWMLSRTWKVSVTLSLRARMNQNTAAMATKIRNIMKLWKRDDVLMRFHSFLMSPIFASIFSGLRQEPCRGCYFLSSSFSWAGSPAG